MNAWLCDRCKKVSTDGNIDDPPEGWRFMLLPVRGTGGARSVRDGLICDGCDDDLYRWLFPT